MLLKGIFAILDQNLDHWGFHIDMYEIKRMEGLKWSYSHV